MQGALFGTETEFACAGEFDPARAAVMVKNQVFSTAELGIIDPPPREWGETPGNGGFLFNGGRLYVDSGHIEYATAECRTLKDIVAHEVAGERILLEALNQLDRRTQIFFIKNNVDYFGHTFGYHENYCLDESPRRPNVVLALMPFLVTRQIYAGAGLVFRPERGPDHTYQIAQRSHVVELDQSRRVRFGGRPIINLRDEPHGQRRRMHVIAGDANRSEWATALKIGTTALVAQMADDGWWPGVELVDAVHDMRRIARILEGPWTVSTVEHGDLPALAVQRIYLEEAERRFAGRDEDTIWTLANWNRVLTALEEDRQSLDGLVDWITKKRVLDSYAESSPAGWGDKDLCKVDLAYHHIDPRVSLYSMLKQREEVALYVPEGQIRGAVLNPPGGTRAFGRARVIRSLSENGADSLIPWRNLRQGLGELTLYDANLYLVYQYIEDPRDLMAAGIWDIIPYMIDWSAIVVKGHLFEMPDPFDRYEKEAVDFAGSIPSILSEKMQTDKPVATAAAANVAEKPASVPQAAKTRTTARAARAAQKPGVTTVTLRKSKFDPHDVTVKNGATVEWVNEDASPHTVTADNGAFESVHLEPKDTFSFVFEHPGEFPYRCKTCERDGKRMAGKVIVNSSQKAPSRGGRGS